MDIKGEIEDVFTKVKNDKDFASKFAQDPVASIEDVIGIDLPNDQMNAIIDGIKAKLTADKAGNVLGSIKKLF